jgi:hypothetical protein
MTRGSLARLILNSIIPDLLEDDATSELHETLSVLSHAAKWAKLLLACDGEPTTPAFNDKTELHRGFRDWVMMEPYYPNRTLSDSETE